MDDATQWTLRELTAEVAAQLERNYEAADNGQVRAIPDERSVRYYTTLGLLDRPAAMRGRTALYGLRHVAQLVAIKRLQGLGKSLAEIQPLLSTVDDDTLSRISGVVLPRAPRRREQRAAFWKQDAAAVASDPDSDSDSVSASVSVPAPGSPALSPPPSSSPSFLPTYAVPLVPGVTLHLTSAHPPTAADADALLAAAAPLLAELARRGF